MNNKKEKRRIERKICAMTADRKRTTNTFNVVFSSKTDDVYIIPEGINNGIKISIHESGEIHTVLPKEYAIANNIPNQSRYLEKHFLVEPSQLTEEETQRFKYEVATCVGFLPTETIDVSEEDSTKADQTVLTFSNKKEMIIVFFFVSVSHEANFGSMDEIDILYKTTLPKSRREFVIGTKRMPLNKDLVMRTRTLAAKMVNENRSNQKLARWFSAVVTPSEDLPDVLVEMSTDYLRRDFETFSVNNTFYGI